MELVKIVAGRFMGSAVDSHAVPDLILHYQHPDFLELLAQLLDVVADDAAVHIHVRVMVEHIQRTGDVDFQSGGDVLRFLFILRTEGIIQKLKVSSVSDMMMNRAVFRSPSVSSCSSS